MEENVDYKVLDRDEFGELRSFTFPLTGDVISVYVTDEGEEYFPTDFQGPQPQTCAEMAEYELLRSDEIDF